MTIQNAGAYFDQTRFGESRWWSWLSVTWIAVVVWVFLSTILGVPMFIFGMIADPEMANQFIEMSGAQQVKNASDPVFSQLSKAALWTTLGAILTWGIRFAVNGPARQFFNIVSGLCMIISTLCFVKIYPIMNDPELNATFMPLVGKSVGAYIFMLLTFPAFLVGLYFCQKVVHRRTLMSLHTAAANFRWSRILFAIAVTWAVLGFFSALMHFTGISPLRATFDPSRFFIYAIATLIFIPLQSGTEEIVFRGYLNQAFGHFISNKWFVFVITSVLFAAMHLSNPEALAGAEGGSFTHILVMSQYFLFGFILSVVVYFEGGLEAAIGVHAGNNMFAAMFVNYEGSVLPTPSAFIAVPDAESGAWATIIVLSVIAYILYKTRKPIIPAPEPVSKGADAFG